MKYQWGHNDPYTFATNTEKWGTGDQIGRYPVKIYTIDGVLIYQESNGGSNKDKQPAGGVIYQSTYATSMMEIIKNPIIFYGGVVVVNQIGHTKSLWDYYWTSYSRGVDGTSVGNIINTSWHNEYLDGYTPRKLKSIYDPCPYGFRVPSNGTYNDHKSNLGWIAESYVGGTTWNFNWFCALGARTNSFIYTAYYEFRRTSTPSNFDMSPAFGIYSSGAYFFSYNLYRHICYSVRCIEELDSSVRPDRRTRPVWKCRRFLY